MRRWAGSVAPAAIAALGWLAAAAPAAGADRLALAGQWRIARIVPAPWARAGAAAPDAAWIGATVRFGPTQVRGPGALDCAGATYERTETPAEGLFQGNLPPPAARSAQALGIARFPVPGIRLTCDAGTFELHRVATHHWLVALDNTIWTLDRSPGALATPESPSGVVQRLLEVHFAGPMRFDASTVSAKRGWLSSRLQVAIARHLARPARPDEVPPIDGDPFTDSQEHPTLFAVGATQHRQDGSASVPVRLGDGLRERTVTYALVRDAGAWRVDDVVFERGGTLDALLR